MRAMTYGPRSETCRKLTKPLSHRVGCSWGFPFAVLGGDSESGASPCAASVAPSGPRGAPRLELFLRPDFHIRLQGAGSPHPGNNTPTLGVRSVSARQTTGSNRELSEKSRLMGRRLAPVGALARDRARATGHGLLRTALLRSPRERLQHPVRRGRDN